MDSSDSDSSENEIHRHVQITTAGVHAVQSQTSTIDNNSISISQQDENFQITSQSNTAEPSTSATKKSTNPQRCKKYRKRQKIQNSCTSVNARTKTAALRMEEYRERKKNMQENNLPITAAQRMKEYRGRIRNMQVLNAINNLSVTAESNFISNKQGLSLYTINCQSLDRHNLDLVDSVTTKSSILLLSETWTDNRTTIGIPNFRCRAQFQKINASSAAKITIYDNNDDTTNIVTPNMQIKMSRTDDLNVRHTNVGDICTAICKMENGMEIVMVVIYISPNQKIQDIIKYIHRALLEHTEEGSRLLGENYYQLPLVLAGNFNVNFADRKSEPLIKFLFDKLHLTMNNDPTQSTTKSGTTIDAVFSRFLNKIHSQTYVSYFSHHKPIIPMIECDDMNN